MVINITSAELLQKKEEFMQSTRMVDADGGRRGVEEAIEYLLRPETTYKLILATELGMPVLTLVAKDLEREFDANSRFPVVVAGDEKNYVFRQNIGRMVKFVMEIYGFRPAKGDMERLRIPAVSGSDYFTTSAVYEKAGDAQFDILITAIKE